MTKQKHSESKKPYREPDIPYNEMEYQFDPWDPTWPRPPELPPVGPNNPGDPPRPPGLPWEDDKPPVDDRFMGCEFMQPLTPDRLQPGETAYARLGRRDDPVIGYTVHGPARVISGSNALCTAAGQQVLVGTPNWSANSSECTVIIRVNDNIDNYEETPGVDGVLIVLIAHTASGRSCSTDAVVEKTTCENAEPFVWDDATSAETVSQSGSVVVAVLGGKGPFTWSISGGTGITLGKSETSSRYNTVHATASACGAATITVTDSCDEATAGDVRVAQNSSWQEITPYQCVVSGNYTSYTAPEPEQDSYGRWELIQGKYKCVDGLRHNGAWGSGCHTDPADNQTCSKNNCDGKALNSPCDTTYGASRCIGGSDEYVCNGSQRCFRQTNCCSFYIDAGSQPCGNCPTGNYNRIMCICRNYEKCYEWKCE